MIQRLNSASDNLPRPRLSCGGASTPTFLACGITASYLAVIMLFGGGLLAVPRVTTIRRSPATRSHDRSRAPCEITRQ